MKMQLTAVEQADLGEVETSFDFALGLGAARFTGPGLEAVVGGEGQETGVVDGPIVVVPQHDHLLIVVQASGGHAFEIGESPDMFADGGREILSIDEAHIGATRVT